jgi:hypothetical protein
VSWLGSRSGLGLGLGLRSGSLLCVLVCSEREPQVLDFQTQQYKLLPQVALSYAILFARLYMMDTYKTMYDTRLSRGDFSLMPEVGLTSKFHNCVFLTI